MHKNIIGIALASLFLLSGYAFDVLHDSTQALPADYRRDAEVFNHVWPLIVDHFVHAIPNTAQVRNDCLARVKIGGYAHCLNDAYSFYMSSEEYDALKLSMSGKEVGIGIRLMRHKIPATILTIMEGTSAWRSRFLKTGDEIISLDGNSVENKSVKEIMRLMQGSEYTTITLGIRRKGKYLPPLSLMREHIEVPSIFSADIDERTSYIRITEFNERTPALLTQELTKRLVIPFDDGGFQIDYRKRVIFDVRKNPGGLLASVGFVNYLFSDDPGEPMVTQVSRGQVISRLFIGDFILGSYPVPPGIFKRVSSIVLIDSGTASAAEIFAEYLHHTTGALRVGVKSYGKGSVQMVISLPDGGALSLTTAEYLVGPQQTRIHNIGIQPEYMIESLTHDEAEDTADDAYDVDILHDPQLRKALELLR